MEPMIARQHSEEQVAKVLEAKEKAVKQAEFDKEKKLSDAREVTLMLQTPGGKILLEWLEQTHKGLANPPEAFLRDDDSEEVSVTKVARNIGAREAIVAVSDWLNGQVRAILLESEKKDKEAMDLQQGFSS